MQPIKSFVEQDFEISDNNDWTLDFVYEINGVPSDVTGFTFTLGIKQTQNTANTILTVAGVVLSPATGLATFTIPKATLATLTANYSYHYYIDVLDNLNSLVTRMKGNLIYSYK